MDFSGFSPDSFEQLVRVIVLKIIGNGIKPFGNGPDGGREATFQGKVPYPYPPQECWNGYGVVQAKFKERREDTLTEQRWVQRQLRAELQRWEGSKKRKKNPEYYIFCTNVELTSVAGTGGHDVVEGIFEEYKEKLGIKVYEIWDASKIATLIDGNGEIRQRFSIFFTPGDLLMRYSDTISFGVSDPHSVLAMHLCRSLLLDEDARVSQAGDKSEERISLASVFLDLPVGREAGQESDDDDDLEDENTLTALRQLLKISATKLDPESLEEQSLDASLKQKLPFERLFSRYAFLGGPGSGKSTIGQFLSQVHRAAILDRTPRYLLEDSVKNAIEEIKETCSREGFSWPATPRYPFRIELNAFARVLASTDSTPTINTLSAYIRADISRDVDIKHDCLRVWLRDFPTLLILDGLDEVPSSSNRSEVVAAIRGFLSEARLLNADIMVVSTSRRDGYNGEFDEEGVELLHLLQFSRERALLCADRYIESKISRRGGRMAEDARRILSEASRNDLIAKLMCSPLQVSFMVTVVAASGKPSESRWQLFNDYYKTIYERELQKAVRPFDRVLNERRQDIDLLHHKVGFILQRRGAVSGGTQAEMPMEEFKRLVTNCLLEDGLEADELQEYCDQIVGAASERLVFLTSRSVGRLSFEVRSLQEYMAAACITTGSEELIERRLERIAHSSYWRNTLLFSVGRFFVDTSLRPLRHLSSRLCEYLNSSDDNVGNACLGSHLAGEILISGIIGNVPAIKRSLVSIAMGLLHLEGKYSAVPMDLVDAYDGSVTREYQKHIELWLGQASLERSLSAWNFVVHLQTKIRESWLEDVIRENWPKNVKEMGRLYEEVLYGFDRTDADQPIFYGFFQDRYIENFFALPIRSAAFDTACLEDDSTAPQWFGAQSEYFKDRARGLSVSRIIDQAGSIEVDLQGVLLPHPEMVDRFKGMACPDGSELGDEWACFFEFESFFKNPSVETLAEALKEIERKDLIGALKEIEGYLPWVVKVVTSNCRDIGSFQEAINKLESGKFGDEPAWRKAEESWSCDGVDAKEFFLTGPFGGVPLWEVFAYAEPRFDVMGSEEIPIDSIMMAVEKSPSQEIRSFAASIVSFCFNRRKLDAVTCEWLRSYCFPNLQALRLDWFELNKNILGEKSSGWIEALNALGCEKIYLHTNGDKVNEEYVRWLLHQYQIDTGRIGLLRLLAVWVGAAREVLGFVFNEIQYKSASKFPHECLSKLLIAMARPDFSADDARFVVENFEYAVSENRLYAIHCIIDSLGMTVYRGGLSPEFRVVFDHMMGKVSELGAQNLDRYLMILNSFLQNIGSEISELELRDFQLPELA